MDSEQKGCSEALKVFSGTMARPKHFDAMTGKARRRFAQICATLNLGLRSKNTAMVFKVWISDLEPAFGIESVQREKSFGICLRQAKMLAK